MKNATGVLRSETGPYGSNLFVVQGVLQVPKSAVSYASAAYLNV